MGTERFKQMDEQKGNSNENNCLDMYKQFRSAFEHGILWAFHLNNIVDFFFTILHSSFFKLFKYFLIVI